MGNNKSTFADQLEKRYHIGRESGDISLVVKSLEQENSCASSPPQKRRRLNDDESVSGLSQNQSGTVMKVSSATLRAASIVFDHMLTTDMKEKESKEIVIHAESVKDVDDLVYFMCTNQLRNDANPLHLFPLGHLYQMDRLMEKCVKRIVETVEIKNYVQTVHLLGKYDLDEELQSVAQFGKRHVKELKKLKNFHMLSPSHRIFALGLVRKSVQPSFRITVRFLTGRMVGADVCGSDTIWDLKCKVRDGTGHPPAQQRIIVCQREKSDDQTLAECGIRPELVETRIFCVLRRR